MTNIFHWKKEYEKLSFNQTFLPAAGWWRETNWRLKVSDDPRLSSRDSAVPSKRESWLAREAASNFTMSAGRSSSFPLWELL